jgi:hypothetical protein
MRVYAGIDPLSRKRHYLTEVVPAGPKAAREAEKVRPRLLAEVDERRNPRTSATVNQLLDRYLGVLEIEDTTRSGYESMIRLYIRPLLGPLRIGRIDGETLDSFYAECSAPLTGSLKCTMADSGWTTPGPTIGGPGQSSALPLRDKRKHRSRGVPLSLLSFSRQTSVSHLPRRALPH